MTMFVAEKDPTSFIAVFEGGGRRHGSRVLALCVLVISFGGS